MPKGIYNRNELMKTGKYTNKDNSTKICKNCGKEFKDWKRTQQNYCNPICRNRASGKRGYMQMIKKDPDYNRKADLKKNYGITIEYYKELYRGQKGKCAICNEYKEILAVDHNHDTKEIRGLLCRPCNSALGLLKEDLKIFNRAIKYLKLPLKVKKK